MVLLATHNALSTPPSALFAPLEILGSADIFSVRYAGSSPVHFLYPKHRRNALTLFVPSPNHDIVSISNGVF